jgi:SM-20-related protein
VSQSSDLFEHICNDIRHQGVSITTLDANNPVLISLSQRLDELQLQSFSEAGIGRQNDHTQNNDIRRDKIQWLSESSVIEKQFLNYMNDLKMHLNSQLFMGLFSYECHFAHYKPGAFYKKHLDAFQGKTNRMLSTVLYLNERWQETDGGELVIYDEHDHQSVIHKVSPNYGTLVTFLSDAFPHEVLPANAQRFSIAGWFRVNNSSHDVIDPPQ